MAVMYRQFEPAVSGYAERPEVGSDAEPGGRARRTMQSDSSPLPVIDSLDELAEWLARSSHVFLRYSEGPEKDSEESASCDYESKS